MQQRALQIVGTQGVARQQAVAVAVVDEGLHGLACAVVKGEGGTHDPHDVAVVLLVAQQLHQPVIVLGIGGLPAAALAEHELILQRLAVLGEAIAVHINAVLAVLGAAQHDPLPLLQVAALHHGEGAVVLQHHAAVHAALLGQGPLAVDLEIFGVHGRAVVFLRSHAVLLCRLPAGIGSVQQGGLGKVGVVIGGEFKSHGVLLSQCRVA